MELNLREYFGKLRRSQPPYVCPHDGCFKSYKSLYGITYHLSKIKHGTGELYIESSTLNNGPHFSMKKRKKRKRFTVFKTRRNVACQNKQGVDDVNSIKTYKYSMSYSESQRLVELEIDNKCYRLSANEPLQLICKEDYELKFSKSTVNTEADPNKQKFPEPKFRIIDDYVTLKPIEIPTSYIQYSGKIDGQHEVEYDMDEEDSAWLDIMNKRRASKNLPPVSEENFELLMDKIEFESYFQIKSDVKQSTILVSDDDAVCSICMLDECHSSNVILFCDLCNLAVHQDCYGVPFIPEEQWLCRRCMHSPSRSVDCVLCPNDDGAFKQTDRGHWAHVVCALWIPEVGFANEVFLEPMDMIETIPRARWKLTCYICKKKNSGVCIQCHKTNCYSSFHVTCAQKVGLYMKIHSQDESLVLAKKVVYCHKHTPEKNDRKNITKNQSDCKLFDDRNSPVLSIPTVPLEKIQSIGSLVDFPKANQFILRLIAYWTLKRLSRNGAPLVKRLRTACRKSDAQESQSDSSEMIELKKKHDYWTIQRQLFERARILVELVKKREKLKRQYIEVHLELQKRRLNEALKMYNLKT